MLETKVFGETIPSVFSDFLHFNEILPMKSDQSFNIYIDFIRKEKKYSYSSQLKKKNWENLDFVLHNRLFYNFENGS